MPSGVVTEPKNQAASISSHLGVGRDGERVAGGRLRAQLALDAGRGRRRQVPDADGARLAAHDQGAPVRQQLAAADVAVAVEAVELVERACLVVVVGVVGAVVVDVPDLDAALAARVHVARGVADGDGADDLAVRQARQQLELAGHARRAEGVGREGGRLH